MAKAKITSKCNPSYVNRPTVWHISSGMELTERAAILEFLITVRMSCDKLIDALASKPTHKTKRAKQRAAMEAGLKDFIRIGRNVQSIRADRDQKAAMKRNLFEAVARWRNALRHQEPSHE